MQPRIRVGLGTALAFLAVACTGPATSSMSTLEPTATPNAPPPSSAATVEATTAATASPEPDPASMDLAVIGCPGGMVLEWTPTTHHNFHHYTALRSLSADIAPDFPPIAPAVDWGRTYTTDPFVTSAVDSSVAPSSIEWNYRVMAYDILDDVVSSSPVRTGVIGQVLELGDLSVTTTDGVTQVSWPAYAGPMNCISSFRVMLGIGRPPNEVLSDQSAISIETDALHPGTTYQLRVDAVRVTPLGSFITARSETVVHAVP